MIEEYQLNDQGHFIIKNYQNKKTFASFLPGIAGKLGIPVWAFYVNRGQGIASFGSKNKNNAIMEFYPANKSYQNVTTKGFRTFFKFKDKNTENFYEPFRNLHDHIKTKMIIAPHSLTLREINQELKLKTEVRYFVLPQENFGSLIRRVVVKNLSNQARSLEILDGMPVLVPYGIEHGALKEVSQTISAWSKVYSFKEKTPFYRLRASAEDEAEIKKMTAGNFYFAFTDDPESTQLLTPLVDRDIIFAEKTDLEEPLGFKREELADYQGEQILENRFPAAMAAANLNIKPGETAEFNSIYGHLADQSRLPEIKAQVMAANYLNKKEAETESIHKFYGDNIFTVSGNSKLDAYSNQTFLDNLLRGGFPITLGNEANKTTYHIFSRKHGDLERDYNDFLLEPTYYSQGNGNFRDVNQNRRTDIFFNPEVKRDNIKTFANLIQADGYNPLVIEGSKFIVESQEVIEKIAAELKTADSSGFLERLEKPFTPGQIAAFIENYELELNQDLETFIDLVIANASSWTEAKFGEGYWIDHWTYNLDLIENYLAVYPDKEYELLIADRNYTFYDSHVKVLPRSKKYQLSENGPRQYDALKEDEEKKKEIETREKFPYYLRTKSGEIYYTDLTTKLITLIINKISSLDPAGTGIEMEANKPGWYDALNGLPGIFGSSIAETMELLRLVEFLAEKLKNLSNRLDFIKLPEELAEFFQEIDQLLQQWKDDQNNFSYWQKASAAREKYRDRVFGNFTGKENKIKLNHLQNFLALAQDKLTIAVEKAREDTGLYTMYYSYEAVTYEETGELSEKGLPLLEVKEFRQHRLPAFLEGQVRAMKILKSKDQARQLHESVQASELFDQSLKMYRVNESLSDQSYEIGRARAFSPGWLENGSIWLHMEYKYLLELIKAGLYEDYYQSIEDALVPFQDPERYGRSILENSSFILSSLNNDKKNHGRGYIARLSGSTAEYLHIWSLMAFGPKPFKFQKGELIYSPEPALRADLFTEKSKNVRLQVLETESKEIEIPANAFAHRFLGHSLVVYHNPEQKDTFGPDKAEIIGYKITTEEGRELEVDGDEIRGEMAHRIRNREIQQIDIYLN